VSGCESPDSLVITLDNTQLVWNSTGLLDRQFYFIFFKTPLSAGSHTLIFKATPPTVNQIRQLCNVEFIEYAGEDKFKTSDSYVGIYPTVASNARVYYRSNNEYCLMRNMSSVHFCDVCKENMWLQFFKTVSVIDDVLLDIHGTSVDVTLNTLQLAQFRRTPVTGEQLIVTWIKDGVEVESLKNAFLWKDELANAAGKWVVQVQFITQEVRVDTNKLLIDTLDFDI